MNDGEPLVDIDPGVMWYFEKDFDPAEKDRPLKILSIQRGVASNNYVPGDWSYFLNTDPITYEKAGYLDARDSSSDSADLESNGTRT